MSTGGGNRDYATVSVECKDELGVVVYSTILTVVVPPKSSGYPNQTVYPPPSSCTASLLKQMAIGKSQTLATTSFAPS